MAGEMRVETIKNLFQSIAYSIPNVGFMDVVDIVVIAFAIYKIISLLRYSTASLVAKGVLILLGVTLLTDVLQLNTVNFILDRLLELGFIALVIVFQPELRRFLERMGSRKLSSLIISKDKQTDMESAIEAVVNACEILSRDRVGALIVFERTTQLGDVFKTGVALDARISVQLLRSVFFPKTALHDGAVILRQGRLAAAGCVLPLTQNTHISSDLGTRHRAAIGMSEVSDAVVVVVSEETGTVSVATGGMLKRHLAPQMLTRILKSELLNDQQGNDNTFAGKLRAFLKMGGDKHEKE